MRIKSKTVYEIGATPMPCFVPLFALGLASYLKVVVDMDSALVAVLATVGAAALAILRVRVGAAITGTFLVVELLALAVLTYLGFAHPERAIVDLMPGLVTHSSASTAPTDLALVITSLALAVFTQAGFNTPVYLSEETSGGSRQVARAVLWSVAAVVVTTMVPITAILIGAKSIADFGRVDNLSAFVTLRGGSVLNVILSLAVAAAIFNAMIAIFVVNARFLYSSGRDCAWPASLSSWLARVHPIYRTPVRAVVALAVVQVAVIVSIDIASLATFISVFFGIVYCFIALAAIVCRAKERGRPRPYSMPCWPIPPLLALASLTYVLAQQPGKDLCIAAVTIAIALAYHRAYLARHPGRRWFLKDAPNVDTLTR